MLSKIENGEISRVFGEINIENIELCILGGYTLTEIY